MSQCNYLVTLLGLLFLFPLYFWFLALKALLGNRYGHRALPWVIPEKPFEVFLSKLSKNADGVKLLSQWYLKDNNAVPPTYILQPITAHFAHYGDLRPENRQQRDSDATRWRLTETQLLQFLRSAATDAAVDGHITAEQKQDFYTSSEKANTHTVTQSVFVFEIFLTFPHRPPLCPQ